MEENSENDSFKLQDDRGIGIRNRRDLPSKALAMSSPKSSDNFLLVSSEFIGVWISTFVSSFMFEQNSRPIRIHLSDSKAECRKEGVKCIQHGIYI